MVDRVPQALRTVLSAQESASRNLPLGVQQEVQVVHGRHQMDAVLSNSETLRIQASEVVGGPQVTGFTLTELVCLWRYRMRTA